MADLKAQLEISADASGVDAGVSKAKRSLADLGESAKQAGSKARKPLEDLGDEGKKSSAKVDAATKNMIGSIQRQIAALQAGSKSGSEYYKVLASQRGLDVKSLQPYLDQLDATAAKQTKATVSTAQMQNALRGVPAQFTDIAVALEGGQKPLTVFLQQGGQLKDMFGGITPAAQALGGYIVGLINPFTLAAAAVGALAYAYYEGSKESDAFTKSLILSGNAAGKTDGQLSDMAKRISLVVGTQGDAADALAQFAATGIAAGDNMERLATIAVAMERNTGQAVSETVKQFVELGKSPVDAAVKLNETTNFLTSSVYQQIKALEQNGRAADAAALAQKAYADALDSRMGDLTGNLGIIERSWRAIKDEVRGAVDAMLDVGRQQTAAQKVADLGKQIALVRDQIKVSGENGRASLASKTTFGQDLQQLLQEQAYLQEKVRMEERAAMAQRAQAEQTKARIAFDKDGEKFLADKVKMEQEIAKARAEGTAAGASQVEIEKRVADIRASHKGLASAGLQVDKSKLEADLQTIKSAQERLVTGYSNAERTLDALHAAHLVSDSQYYAEKRKYIELESQAEQDALEKEISRLQREKLSGKDKIDNDRKIADAEAKLAIARANSAAKQQINTVAEVAANLKVQRSYEDARQSAQAYLDTVARQNAADVAGIGRGTEFRSNQAGLNRIEDRFTQQRQGLERDKRNGLIDQSQFDTYLKIAQDTYAKEVKLYEDRNKAIKTQEGDWVNGFNEALANYKTNAENVAGQSAAAFTDAFDGLTNGIADSFSKAIVYGQNLEDSLKNVALNIADSFISSFLKIELEKILIDKLGGNTFSENIGAQSLSMVAMAGLNAFAATAAIPIVGPELAPAAAASAAKSAAVYALAANAAASSGARELGGPVSAGKMYQVNEKGPELLHTAGKTYLMMGAQGGNVTPHGQSGAGPVTIINQTSARIGKVTERRLDNGERALILEEAVETISAQMGDPNSKTSRALSRNFSLQRSR